MSQTGEIQPGDSDLLSRDSDLEPVSYFLPYGMQEGGTLDMAAPRRDTHPQSKQQGREVSDLEVAKRGKSEQELCSPVMNESNGTSDLLGSSLVTGSRSGLRFNTNRSPVPPVLPLEATDDRSDEHQEDGPETHVPTDTECLIEQTQQHDNWRTTRTKIHCAAFIFGVGVVLTGVSTIVLLFLLLNHYVFLCNGTPSSHVMPLAKNSSAIVINDTNMASALECFEPWVEVSTSFPVKLYQSNCNNPSHSLPPVNHKSILYIKATNPLPVVFDQNYQNYLTDANISVMVNISSKVSSNEFLFVCLYDDYYRFQTLFLQSSNSADFWRAYKGTECSTHEITHGSNEISNDFYISSPRYVFIGVGSTIDPLDTFQFTLSVNGRTISEPGPQSQIRECIGLDDQHPSCKFKLNITDNLSESCIISSRPVDRVSKEPFSNLTVNWTSRQTPKVQEIAVFTLMSGMVLIGIIVAVVASVALHHLRRLPTSTNTPYVQGPPHNE